MRRVTATLLSLYRLHKCTAPCVLTDLLNGGLGWEAMPFKQTHTHTQSSCLTLCCPPGPAGSRWHCSPGSRRDARKWPWPACPCTARTSPPCGAEWSRHLTKKKGPINFSQQNHWSPSGFHSDFCAWRSKLHFKVSMLYLSFTEGNNCTTGVIQEHVAVENCLQLLAALLETLVESIEKKKNASTFKVILTVDLYTLYTSSWLPQHKIYSKTHKFEKKVIFLSLSLFYLFYSQVTFSTMKGTLGKKVHRLPGRWMIIQFYTAKDFHFVRFISSKISQVYPNLFKRCSFANMNHVFDKISSNHINSVYYSVTREQTTHMFCLWQCCCFCSIPFMYWTSEVRAVFRSLEHTCNIPETTQRRSREKKTKRAIKQSK